MGPSLPSSPLDAPPRALPRWLLPAATCAAMVGLTLLTYWPTIFHRYGFRDDYPLLREAIAQPGKILAVCAAQGRVFYGALLELWMGEASNIEGLQWVRLASALGLGALASLLFFIFGRIGWPRAFAALLAVFLVLMPPAQVLVSWATCFPQVVSLLLASSAFALIELPKGGRAKALFTVVRWSGAILGMAAAALTYQPNALFYLVPVAAALVVRGDEPVRQSVRWLFRHGLVTASGLAVAYGLMTLSFALELFRRSPRVRFEHDLVWKIDWMLRDILPDALAQPIIGGEYAPWATAYRLMVGGVTLFICAGVLLEFRRHPRRGALWLLALATFPLASFAISIVAAERWATYRSIYPLTGIVTVFVVASLRNLSTCVPARWRRLPLVALGGLTLAVAFHARQQTFELFAYPQGRELAIMEEGADRLARSKERWVYVITATQSDTAAPHRYRDEFGSVSMDAGWIAKDVLTLLMKEPGRLGPGALSFRHFESGPIDPVAYVYDVVIDLRRISTFRRPKR